MQHLRVHNKSYRRVTFLNLNISSIRSYISYFFIYPDLIKTRLQIQSKLQKQGGISSTNGVQYQGFVRGLIQVIRNERFRGLFKGSSASVYREASYSTIRMGLYKPIQNGIMTYGYGDPERKKVPLIVKICAGASSGGIGSFLANPTDLVKIRMQADATGTRYSGFWNAMSTIFREEGLKGLYTGVSINVARAMVLTSSQLSAYDSGKQYLISDMGFKDDFVCHFAASVFAGFVSATTTSPIDVMKSRIMNQKVKMYNSIADCMVQTLREEGFRAFYKGWFPSWVRIGPHTVISFLIIEKLRFIAGVKPF